MLRPAAFRASWLTAAPPAVRCVACQLCPYMHWRRSIIRCWIPNVQRKSPGSAPRCLLRQSSRQSSRPPSGVPEVGAVTLAPVECASQGGRQQGAVHPLHA